MPELETGASVDDEALEISLVNDLRELARVAARIDEFLATRNLGPQVGYAVNLAVDEVLTNTITFGYHDDEPQRNRGRRVHGSGHHRGGDRGRQRRVRSVLVHRAPESDRPSRTRT